MMAIFKFLIRITTFKYAVYKHNGVVLILPIMNFDYEFKILTMGWIVHTIEIDWYMFHSDNLLERFYLENYDE